jgi:hypothetical protein
MLPVELIQTVAGPEMAGTGNGLTVTAKPGEGSPFPQTLVPYTVICPETAVAPKLTVMVLVPAPEVIVAPAGSVQLYVLALGIDGTVYMYPVPLMQTCAGPVMVPPVEGAGQVVVKVRSLP